MNWVGELLLLVFITGSSALLAHFYHPVGLVLGCQRLIAKSISLLRFSLVPLFFSVLQWTQTSHLKSLSFLSFQFWMHTLNTRTFYLSSLFIFNFQWAHLPLESLSSLFFVHSSLCLNARTSH